jgi:pentatricopeptide repeat domain-containing protein 1
MQKLSCCKAIELLTKLKDHNIQPSVCTYNILINGLCKSGRLKDAQKVYEDLLVKGYNIDVYAYNAMIKGFCKKGLFDDALAVVSKMKDSGCSPDIKTFEIIIHSLFDRGENDKARKMIRQGNFVK